MSLLTLLLPAGWSILSFLLYFLSSRKLKKDVRGVVVQRLFGVIFLGILPYLLGVYLMDLAPSSMGIKVRLTAAPPWWSWIILLLIPLLAGKQASSASNLATYPQIRIPRWNLGILLLSAASWLTYLVAYEFLFRGFLLFSTLENTGVVPAVALNCLLYAAAHYYKGWTETLGSIPVGVFLCYLTIVTGSIWPAILVHSAMALSNEWCSLSYHPNMQLKLPWKT
jgi:membrane protease YdiL (CAAX protease family)